MTSLSANATALFIRTSLSLASRFSTDLELAQIFLLLVWQRCQENPMKRVGKSGFQANARGSRNKKVGHGQPGLGLTARADHSSLAQLLAQALHGLGLAAHAQERTLGIGALLQHRARGEDLPAQVLRRPGKEELGLDEAPLEERDYRLAQPGDIALPLRAHHDAAGVLRAQRRFPFGLDGGVPTAVDLVEDEKARHV